MTTSSLTVSAASPPSSPPDSHGGGGNAPGHELALPSSFGLSGGSADLGPSSWATADPQHPYWRATGPWPEWVTSFREHQLQAVEEILDAYNRGAEAVFLDAPTGAGKTLIGEMVRRAVGQQALYVCHSLGLQDQFLADFPYASVLKGRANYPTQSGNFPELNCGDCTLSKNEDGESSCTWCYLPETCSYQAARKEAWTADVAVVNTSYLLAEANHVGNIVKGRGLIIADEADTLESLVMGAAEYRVSEWMMRRLGVEPPKKGSHAPTVAGWLTGELTDGIKARLRTLGGDESIKGIRERQQLERMKARVEQVAREIQGDAWTRDYDSTNALILKPITVDHVAADWVWKHAPRWLLMSATLVSTSEMVKSLGMDDMAVETVRVPMTFPVENRPIYAVPAAEMTAKKKDESWPKMATAVGKIMQRHPDEKVLVHTVSYELARYLDEWVPGLSLGFEKFTYSSSQGREQIVQRFKAHPGPAVMFAPSLDRGFDFKGDEARVVVVCKVPYPYLGDRQVSERMHTRGGQEWYTVQAIRSLVQMTGRGVRSAEDWCATYILDSAFLDRVWKKERRLLPKWWRDAVDTTVTRRDLGVRS